MKPFAVTGAAAALVTMTAIPVWAVCHDTASVREPDNSVQSESNADVDIAAKDSHVRAAEVAVEDLEEHQVSQGSEDPAPEGYTTNVPPEQIEDDADVGETTPSSSEEESEKRDSELAAEAKDGGSETKAMKTSVDATGEYAKTSKEESEESAAKAGENTEKVAELSKETMPGENGQVEAATGGAEPTENWFGCSGEQTGEEACEESAMEASPDAETGAEEEEQEYAELDAEGAAKREVNLDVDCEDEPGTTN